MPGSERVLSPVTLTRQAGWARIRLQEDMLMTTSTEIATITERYQAVRALTESLAEPISAEEQTIQSMPDASPTKWHRGHTSWFFETFLLRNEQLGYDIFDDQFGFLFNSYYDAVGERLARPSRGILGRPSVATVGEYRRHVDEAMIALLAATADGGSARVAQLVELGLNHEQQHQELLLMDIKYTLAQNPIRPGYRDGTLAATPTTPLEWLEVTGGIFSIGHGGNGFSFDNESPRHEVLLDPFQIASRPVTNGDWLGFIADGGYQRSELWLSEGWATTNAKGWHHPEYWISDDGWHQFTLDGVVRLDRDEPVSHVSFFEADAYARWSGTRLPTEFEWECAARRLVPEGPGDGINSLDSGRLHPGGPVDGIRLYGDVWEWTASPYVGYPGFRPAEGAVGEYNGKFMVNQQVLRGGCCLTPTDHMRNSYRNYFPAHTRWQCSGLRLAR